MKKKFNLNGYPGGAFGGLIETPLEEQLGERLRKSIDLDQVLPTIVALQASLPVKVRFLFAPTDETDRMKIFIIGPESVAPNQWDAIEKAFLENGFEQD